MPAGILKTVAFIFISPLLGLLLGSLLFLAISWIFVRSTPSRVDRLFRRLQLFSSSLYSLGHGGNDAQKTIGIIWMLLIAGGIHAASDDAGADLGGRRLLHRDRPGHDVRRLAHRQDHGPAHHQDPPGRRLLRRALRARSRCSSPRRSAFRYRRRTPSPARSSASARRRRCPRCAGASPATSSGPGSSPFPARPSSPGSSWWVARIILRD